MEILGKQLLKTFFLRAVILLIAWLLVFHLYILPKSSINNSLTTMVVRGTAFGLESLGFEVETSYRNENDHVNRISGIIYIDSTPAVLVADPCNGLELFALFIGFFLCFPGSWISKTIFIIFGVTFLFLLNILREIMLALNYHYFQSSFDFNHKYTFAIFVYLAVFLIWRFWLNRYMIISHKK